MGPGRTGVKGVLRDRAEAVARERAARAADTAAHNARLEARAPTARTYLEDLAAEERDAARGRGAARIGRFGHLREVGSAGYVSAIEGEARGTWVVVHIYDPVSAPLCDCDCADR